ncbi:AraC family transcriptional regulator [Amycolatopsis sp. NPDC004368]
MDALSRLIRLARLEAKLAVRCVTAGQSTSDHEAAGPGRVPFHLVLEGTCTVSTGSATVELGPGDLLLLPGGNAHRVTAVRRRFDDVPGPRSSARRDAELELYCGYFRFDSAAGALLFRLLPDLVHVTLDTPAVRLAGVLRGETRFDGPGADILLCSLCDALLTMALRRRPEHRLDTPALWTVMGDDVLGRVIVDVVERPGEPWTIDRMAAAAAMSRATFLRRFSARTGTTVGSLLTSIRMMVAADLLARSDYSVGRVAGEVGYRSESAFGQAFRSTVGTLPSEFRKNSVGAR